MCWTNFIVRYDTAMRRLTLILSDFYLPADSAREALPDALPLPSLQWLLRFSNARTVGDWRQWLARDRGAEWLAGSGRAAALATHMGVAARGAWLATPVSLEARLDHVRLRDRGLLRLRPEHRQSLCDDFARSFGPALALHELGDRGFLLEGGPASPVATVDPARLLDADVGPALPAAGDAGEFRRLAAEIEMWLHSASSNDAREKSGQRRITSLWLWGGGSAPSATPRGKGVANLYGGDPWLRALAGAEPLSVAPASFADLLTFDHATVEFAPLSGVADESLDSLEAKWFDPCRAALSSGALASLTLVANDKAFVVHARAAWRFWRPRRGWLASLAKA
jgi:hypothetical protein